MRVLVAGVNGYLGRHLARHLTLAGQSVVGFGSAAESRAPITRYVQGDISTPGLWEPHLAGADRIFFFAGRTGTTASIDQADAFLLANELPLARLLTAVARSPYRPRIVFPSSRLYYRGRPGRLAETDEPDFKTLYAVNKFACERMLELFARHHGVPFTVLRICVPYGNLLDGPRSHGTLGFLLDQVESRGRITLFGDGEQRRTFTHVADICEAVAEAASHPEARDRAFNVGGEDLSLREVAELICADRGARLELAPWPPRDALVESGDTVFDSSRLEAILGHGPRRSLRGWLQELREASV